MKNNTKLNKKPHKNKPSAQLIFRAHILSVSQEIRVTNISVALIGKNESQRRYIRMMVIEAAAGCR